MAEHFSDKQVELFKQLAGGARTALQQIAQLNEQLMLTAIQQIVRNPGWAAEVWNDTIQALWTNRETVAEKDNPVAWLMVTARHKAINKIRDEKRKATFSLDLLKDIPAASNIAAELEAKEYQKLIEQALQQLSPAEKRVYHLVIKEGLDRKQAATYLKISENTVKNQLRNAMISLRKQLAKLMSTILI